MTVNAAQPNLIKPPADVPEIQRGNWLDVSDENPVVAYLVDKLWEKDMPPRAWKVARLSKAAYLYREKDTGWTVVGKFYVVKGGDAAPRYARREWDYIQQAQSAGLASGRIRTIRPLSIWRGILFLEYVDGLTLEDVIAVRHSRPGTLSNNLAGSARFLATLHTHGVQSDARPNFDAALAYAQKVIKQLAKHGVLKAQPLVQEALNHLIDRWSDRAEMNDFTPTLVHGDVTTTNFIFAGDQIVVIDWERLETADPAADLGRLMAEVTHSIHQHGGTIHEALPFVDRLVASYREALPDNADRDAVLKRARFYRASSTLRIARNGWISRLDRTALVAQAMALFADI